MLLLGERQLGLGLVRQTQAQITQQEEQADRVLELLGVAAGKATRELDPAERSGRGPQQNRPVFQDHLEVERLREKVLVLVLEHVQKHFVALELTSQRERGLLFGLFYAS